MEIKTRELKKKPIFNTISMKNDSYLGPEIIVIFLT